MPHTEGNWATYVFVRLSQNARIVHKLNKTQDKILDILSDCRDEYSFERTANENLHITLSKTLYLKYL